MATLNDVNTALATLSTDVDAKFAEIDTKVTAIEVGQGVTGATETQLDVLVGAISTINSKVNAYVLPAPAVVPAV